MSLLRLLAVVSTAAIVSAGLPAVAEGEAPAACGGSTPVIADNEVLVERTLYLHGTTRAGNVDQAQEFAAGVLGGKKFMDANAPTGSDFKVDAVLPGSNANFNGNFAMAYWRAQLPPEGARIVCADTSFFGTAQGTFTVKLFIDKAWADVNPDSSKPATATGADNVKSFSATFGLLDVEAYDNLVLQVTPSQAGAVLYDSAEYPSKFTYVTVEPAPAPVPDPTPAPAP